MTSPNPFLPSFSIERRTAGATSTIALAGELDMASELDLTAALEAALAASSAIVLDLREVSFMDSTGIRALAQARQRCVDAGRRLVLLRPSPQVLRPLEVCGLAWAFEVVDGPDQLVASAA